MRAAPTPWVTPASMRVASWAGLRIRPTSWATAISTTRTAPSSTSTSTTARIAQNARPTKASPWPASSSGSVGWGRHWAVAHSSLPSSASVTVVDRTPSYEVILPSVIWSSSVDMPNLWASGWRSWVRTIFAARSTAPPETQVCRPWAAGPAGGWSVSTGATCTSSMPRVSCTTWRASVEKPEPVSTAEQMTVAAPSATRTVAVETSSVPSAPSMWTMPSA